jgi:hypothetical protein
MRRNLRIVAGLAALALTLGAAACGDDDDDDTSASAPSQGEGETAAGGDTEKFCSDLVDFNTAAFSIDLDEDSNAEDTEAAASELGPLFESMAENAPDELADAIEEMTPAMTDLEAGDATAFNADATLETYLGLVSQAVETCELDTVAVSGVDYAFEGVPATIEAGTVAFEFTNESDAEEHQMIVFRKPEGDTRPAEELLNDPALEETGPGEFVAAAFGPPGAEGAALAELEAGDYMMVCFLPVGGTEGNPPHFTQGMVAEFSVE